LILTGGLVLGLVAFLPVFELAKLASAFLALVLALICVAQIAFRSSNLWWYRPRFHAPGYPWVPLIGVGACLFLITQLGADAILGALGIIVGGVIWYQVYGRSRAIKENAFRESVRQQGMARLLQLTEEALADDERRITVVSGRAGSDSSLFRIGRPMAGSSRDSVNFLHPGDDLVNRIAEYEPGLLVGAATRGDGHGDNLPADRDVALLTGDSLGEISRIDVLGSGGPYDVLKICLAAKIAEEEGASIRFVHVLDPAASKTQVRALEKFHEDLGELVNVATESMVIQSEDLLSALTSAVDDTDLAIIGAPRGRHFFTDLIDRIVERVPAPVLLVRVAEKDEPTTIRNVFHRFVTNRLGK
jgi:nucleotide-binding universal stress UspA family protein